jgi:hypothetical protein
MQARSCNHRCSGRAMSITYSKSVFAALVVRQATRMRLVVICSLSDSTNFRPHYLINGTIVENSEHKMCVLTFSTTSVRNVSHSKINRERYDKKCILVSMYSTRYSCPILMKLEFSRQNSEKYPGIKLHANSPNGNRVFPYETDGQIRQLIVAFHNFANGPDKHKQKHLHISQITHQPNYTASHHSRQHII